MKKVVFIAVLIALNTILSAQTHIQQGYVKTKGRLSESGAVIPGSRISNATVIIKDRTPVVSQEDGAFSFPIPSNVFFLSNVKKQGFVLTDPDVLSKQYKYSTNDLVIVMETPTEQWQDKFNAQKTIRQHLQKQLDKQRLELEKLKEEMRVSEEEYRERLQQIFEQYEDNDILVNEMAEEFAKIDYDQLSEKNRIIRQCILSGEFSRADSLIHSKGSFETRIKELNKHQESIEKETETLSKRQAQLESNEEGVQKELDEVASDCYSKFNISQLRHINDSAAYYI